jgi:succinylarginine dihydrolase
MAATEVNFDGIVGLTHHYAGLGAGNLASQKFKHTVSNPRKAALEGLAKMKLLAEMGIWQAVLPPQLRPDIAKLRRFKFSGTDAEVLRSAAACDLSLLSEVYSASAMWAANAATVSPSADTSDGRLHFTIANLSSQLHRSLEAPATLEVFQRFFADESLFGIHPPVRNQDEGAANHARLCESYDSPGLEIFVYGRGIGESSWITKKFPPRQSRAASEEVACRNQLDPSRTLFIRQNPAAIDAGVFHNDVICVGNQNVLLFHEEAFAPEQAEYISRAYTRITGGKLHALKISSAQLPIVTAVETYLFNSQLITLPDGKMMLLAPAECERNPQTVAIINQLLADENPIAWVRYVDVRQSMQNGGGPACLRLRVVMTEAQRNAIRPRVFLDDGLYCELVSWVERHYRNELSVADLADANLLTESRQALSELALILRLDA